MNDKGDRVSNILWFSIVSARTTVRINVARLCTLQYCNWFYFIFFIVGRGVLRYCSIFFCCVAEKITLKSLTVYDGSENSVVYVERIPIILFIRSPFFFIHYTRKIFMLHWNCYIIVYKWDFLYTLLLIYLLWTYLTSTRIHFFLSWK